MFKFRDYQKSIVRQGSKLLKNHNLLYLAMEVRTGKTFTSLGICNKINSNNVLFITKKKAISSIEDDFKTLKPDFKITVINYESLHKISTDQHFDVLILDEAHSIGAYPKKNKRCLQIQSLILIHDPKVILLSGTPTPESFSQMYHQVCSIPGNPFSSYKNFYQFCKHHVDVKQRRINGLFMNDYSRGRDSILKEMKPYTISFTQKEAGFVVDTDEEILLVELEDSTKEMIKTLSKDRILKGSEEVVLADTPVKLMTKTHQLCSGTVKFESGNSQVVDYSKANFIHKKFGNKKVGIFYKFKEELNALKKVYKDDLCVDLETFNSTNKTIALQIVSGREGISLRQAEALIYYNIDFSATSYWQSRDRMTTKERLYNKIYWIFSKGGIESDIYEAVLNKKDYTLNHFKRDSLNL
ncbi:MAG: hypothetical protein CMJ25_20750 [Phycisphaerae bacterium]|nr:hypothetical protein [Phycisphaerae bacterium]|tara:strand:- start:2769 stop:4004 length:1236 start_codon:yes stop_codon:yes gene_type:complete